jgi:hypothetical protein
VDPLPPPYQFFHPQPEIPFELAVVRFEVGLAQRPINDPPYSIVRPTIRFHLATPVPPALFLAVRTSGSADTGPIDPDVLAARPYLDFTNQLLIKNVLEIYGRLLDKPRPMDLATLSREELVEELVFESRLSPLEPEPVVLRLTRHGLRIDTVYDVRVLEPR